MTTARTAIENKCHERILAKGIVDFATELRLADVSTLVTMIVCCQEAHIADLVNSSSELHFRAGTLRYALFADYEVQWGMAPLIRVNMEFCNSLVTAFFRVILDDTRATVELIEIMFEEEGMDFQERLDHLQSAINDARIGVLN